MERGFHTSTVNRQKFDCYDHSYRGTPHLPCVSLLLLPVACLFRMLDCVDHCLCPNLNNCAGRTLGFGNTVEWKADMGDEIVETQSSKFAGRNANQNRRIRAPQIRVYRREVHATQSGQTRFAAPVSVSAKRGGCSEPDSVVINLHFTSRQLLEGTPAGLATLISHAPFLASSLLSASAQTPCPVLPVLPRCQIPIRDPGALQRQTRTMAG